MNILTAQGQDDNMVDSTTLNTMKRQKVNPTAIKKVEELLEFLEKAGLGFYNCEWPLVRERNEGCKQFIDVTISIRTSGEARIE